MPSPETPPPPKRWLTRQIFAFGLTSFLSDAGHEAATTALPALLASMGAPPAALGIIEGVADGLTSLARLGGGWLADKPTRRKPLAVAGYLLTGIASGAYALATSWPHILLARSMGWMARGIRSPSSSAMLADATTPATRGRAFGFHRMMDTAGAVAGPALAVFLLATIPLRAVFVGAFIPGVLAALAFATLVRADGRGPAKPPLPFVASLAGLPAHYRRFLGAVFVFGLGDFARTLLILRASTLLAPSMGTAHAATFAMSLYVGHNVLYAAASYPVGWLADKISHRRLLVVGYGLGVVTAVLAALATPSIPMLVLLFAVAGLVLAFEDTLEGAVAADAVPSELRGTGYGALATANGLGDLVSSAGVGVLWTVAGPEVAFGVAAVVCAAGTVLMAMDGRGQTSAG